MKKVLVMMAAMMAVVLSARAEEESAKAVDFAYEAGAEVVSAYIWRGQYNGSLSFQPTASIGFDALDEAIQFRAGVWGNIGASDWMFKKDQGDGTGYTKFMPELDVMLSFSAYGASVGMNHYYYCDGSNFFSWQSVNDIVANNSTSTTEVWAGYSFDHFFGVGAYINWYTTVAGNDLVWDENDVPHRAWSSYIELGYDYTWEKIGLTLGGQIGMSPWASDLYGNSKFAVTNLTIKLNKEWEFDACTVDIFAQGTLNPDGVTTQNAIIPKAGDDKLYCQKLNAVLGCGIWF